MSKLIEYITLINIIIITEKFQILPINKIYYLVISLPSHLIYCKQLLCNSIFSYFLSMEWKISHKKSPWTVMEKWLNQKTKRKTKRKKWRGKNIIDFMLWETHLRTVKCTKKLFILINSLTRDIKKIWRSQFVFMIDLNAATLSAQVVFPQGNRFKYLYLLWDVFLIGIQLLTHH